MATEVKAPRDVNRTRTQIAFIIIGLGMVGISAVSWVALSGSTAAGRPEMARLVFASVLPLFGTWVGTVLAFYFVRDNLQAANETTLNTIKAAGGLDPQSRVSDIMIVADKIKPKREVASDSDARKLLLGDLYKDTQTNDQSRVPILTTAGEPLYVVHVPDMHAYAQQASKSADAFDADDTLDALLTIPALRTAVTSFLVVDPYRSLASVRDHLSSLPECKDVFVTASGRTSERVLGWLTSSDIARTN